MKDFYIRRAKLIRVIDGDTLEMEIDLGFHITIVNRVRLARIDAPEMRSRSAEERLKAHLAKTYVEAWFAKAHEEGEWVIIRSEKGDSFGRYIAELYTPLTNKNLSDGLLEAGLASFFA